MTDRELQEIETRCEAATPGPWKGIRKTGYVYAVDCVTAKCGDSSDKVLVQFNGERWGNDAEFIAHSRSDVPALIGEVKRLRALVIQHEEEQAAVDNYMPPVWPSTEDAK